MQMDQLRPKTPICLKNEKMRVNSQNYSSMDVNLEKPKEPVSRGQVVVPQPVTDRSIIDSVADFINDVVPAASIISSGFENTNSNGNFSKDVIQWAQFQPNDSDLFNRISLAHRSSVGLTTSPVFGPSSTTSNCNNLISSFDVITTCPLFLVIAYTNGIQIWAVEINGKAVEVMSWRNGFVKLLRFLPNPNIDSAVNSDLDLFSQQRPLIVLYENTSNQSMYHSLNFISLLTGDQVKCIRFRNAIIDVQANKKSIIVAFNERLAIFSATTLEDRMIVTTCYPSPGLCANPISLGVRWLAYADNHLDHSLRSVGGNESENLQSYTATVLNAAKSLGKGLFEFGGSVASIAYKSTQSSGSLNSSSGSSSTQTSSTFCDNLKTGIVTILDTEMINSKEKNDETKKHYEANTIAHFIANSEPIVQLKFDYSGQLLFCADKRGHDFHIFQIFPNTLGSHLAAVHHLYILHRGDTTAKVQDVCFSHDSRWIAISTTRGTSHVFPITPYGGSIVVRTHCSSQVVNRLSRYRRSAGIMLNDGCSNSQLVDPPQHLSLPYPNPRLFPCPQPTTVYPLAQIRQPISLHLPNSGLIQRATSMGRQRLISLSDESLSIGQTALRLTTCFAQPRSLSADFNSSNNIRDLNHGQNSKIQTGRFTESFYTFSSLGLLTQYDLQPKASSLISKEKICETTPIELDINSRAQWILQRSLNDLDLKPPLAKNNTLMKYLFAQNQHNYQQNVQHNFASNNWLSQVEILSHVGPHRRLWMGPQFVFKVCNNNSMKKFGSKQYLDSDAIEIEVYVNRSKQLNTRETSPVIMECASFHNSYEQLYESQIKLKGDYCVPVDIQLRENLADAMLDISSTNNIRIDKSDEPKQSMAKTFIIKKVVNPSGTVVTLQDVDNDEDDANNNVVMAVKDLYGLRKSTNTKSKQSLPALSSAIMVVNKITSPEKSLIVKVPEPLNNAKTLITTMTSNTDNSSLTKTTTTTTFTAPTTLVISKKSKKSKSKLGVKLSDIQKIDDEDNNEGFFSSLFEDDNDNDDCSEANELNLNIEQSDIIETFSANSDHDCTKAEINDGFSKFTKKRTRRKRR